MTLLQQYPVITATTKGSSIKSSSRRGRRRCFFLFGKKAEPEQEQPAAFDTIGGVYSNDTLSFSSTSHSKSLRSIDTNETSSSHDDSSSHSSSASSTLTYNWISSGSPGHHKGAPLIAKRARLGNGRRGLVVKPSEDDEDEEVLDQAEALSQIMLKTRQLPKDASYYASNHLMINAERTKRIIYPLVRDTVLDSLARAQAADMASSNTLYHSDPFDLQLDIDEPLRRLGENVTSGSTTVRKIQEAMMDSAADKNNILDRRFTHMGTGTAKATDGTLYLCQLFRG
jgi:uncharacterized protein YkwD